MAFNGIVWRLGGLSTLPLHWLPLTARIQFKIAPLTFDCARGTGPVYLKQVICMQSRICHVGHSARLKAVGGGPAGPAMAGPLSLPLMQKETMLNWYVVNSLFFVYFFFFFLFLLPVTVNKYVYKITHAICKQSSEIVTMVILATYRMPQVKGHSQLRVE